MSLNLRKCGARGSGSTDDTAAVQSWIDAGIEGSYVPPLGKRIVCPAGVYKLTSTVTIKNVVGLRMIGSGASVFKWAGDPSAPMFDLQNVSNSEFVSFRVTTRKEVAPLAEAFRLQHVAGGIVTPSANVFRGILCEGVNGGIGICWRGMVGSFGDANVDFMYFDNVRAANYAVAGWSIEGGSMHNWTFRNSHSVGGRYAVSGGDGAFAKANIDWAGGFVGNNTIADFYLQTPEGPGLTTAIRNVGSEGSARFLETNNSGAAAPTLLEAIRFSSNGLHADGTPVSTLHPDGFALKLRNPGPYTIINGNFGEDYSRPVRVHWDYIRGYFRPQLAFYQSMVKGALSAASDIFPVQRPTTAIGLTAQTSDTGFAVLD